MPNVLYRDHMGHDLAVVNDARISFAAETGAKGWKTVDTHQPDEGARTQSQVPELEKRDKGLIRFLARGCRSDEWEAALSRSVAKDGFASREEAEAFLKHIKRMPTHWTPFGHQMIKLRVKAPTNIRTQCYKHKIGMVENEESRRYIKATPEIFIPEYRLAPETDIKQGSAGPHPDAEKWKQVYKDHTSEAVRLYEQMLAASIAPEQARFVLPQGAIVNWVWTGSLYAFAEFYNKRSDRGHAQGEVADIADEVSEVIRPLFPVSWDALTQ